MAKHFVFSVRDMAAELWGKPFLEPAMGAGVRALSMAVNNDDPQNLLGTHPEHFYLFHLGMYDDATGLFDCGSPKQIASGLDLYNAGQAARAARARNEQKTGGDDEPGKK